MKRLWIVGLAVVLCSMMAQAQEWFQDFESDPLYQLPAQWFRSGNEDSYVSADQSWSGAQSFRLHGSVGGCWGAHVHRLLGRKLPYVIRMKVRTGAERLYSCHPDYARVQLRVGPSWRERGLAVIHFTDGKRILTRGNHDLGSFELERWYDVAVLCEETADDKMAMSYWIDADFRGTFEFNRWELQDQIAWLCLVAEEGTAWYDDVSIESIYDVEGSIKIRDTDPEELVVTLVQRRARRQHTVPDKDGDYAFETLVHPSKRYWIVINKKSQGLRPPRRRLRKPHPMPSPGHGK